MSDFVCFQSDEVLEFYNLGFDFIRGLQGLQRLVDGENFVVRDGRGNAVEIPVVPLHVAAVTNPPSPPRAIHQDSSHRFGCRAEEVPPILEVWGFAVCQLEPGVVNESCGLKSLSGRLPSHLGRGQCAQFIVNLAKQRIAGVGVARLDALQNLCDLCHARLGRDGVAAKRF